MPKQTFHIKQKQEHISDIDSFDSHGKSKDVPDKSNVNDRNEPQEDKDDQIIVEEIHEPQIVEETKEMMRISNESQMMRVSSESYQSTLTEVLESEKGVIDSVDFNKRLSNLMSGIE